ncbi:hypothetical protein [Neolewinella aurantiaca]|uniref:hypothetical protein n=1 Tax=Neolewinella aurantiaca TaxID=2602767 RepID=UPI00165027E8|nr:hypothetical protein [Neolewinella aurantiaca]
MRHYFSLFLALFAAIFGFYLIWQFAQPELNGHWEIVEGGAEMGSPPITSLYIWS